MVGGEPDHQISNIPSHKLVTDQWGRAEMQELDSKSVGPHV